MLQSFLFIKLTTMKRMAAIIVWRDLTLQLPSRICCSMVQESAVGPKVCSFSHCINERLLFYRDDFFKVKRIMKNRDSTLKSDNEDK